MPISILIFFFHSHFPAILSQKGKKRDLQVAAAYEDNRSKMYENKGKGAPNSPCNATHDSRAGRTQDSELRLAVYQKETN